MVDNEITLPESETPTHFFSIQPDLPIPPLSSLNPGTKRPIPAPEAARARDERKGKLFNLSGYGLFDLMTNESYLSGAVDRLS